MPGYLEKVRTPAQTFVVNFINQVLALSPSVAYFVHQEELMESLLVIIFLKYFTIGRLV
jgi:hypothetical protein